MDALCIPSRAFNVSLTWQSVVVGLHLTPRAFLPMRSVEELNLISGMGVEWDRYFNDTGLYSNLPEVGRQITLFEEEMLDALKRDHGVALAVCDQRS